MNPIQPKREKFLLPEGTTETSYARLQPQYCELPSLRTPDGRVVSQWVPTPKELDAIKQGQPITLVSHTFNQPLQPIILTVGGIDLR